MTQHDIMSSVAIFSGKDKKMCDLYDSQNEFHGQAYGIKREINIEDGVKTLSFSIPYLVDDEQNFRWQYVKSEYLVRLIYKGKTEWYVAQKPIKHKDSNGVYGDVTCSGTETLLKSKNIYMEFDDTNGIGTLAELADKVLAGTGWHRGYTDAMLEADGVTEKIRSLSSGNKQGALGLIGTLCELFKCYPMFDSDTNTVEFYNFNNRSQVLEGTIGQNLDAISATYNSSDICTRLYVEGEYGENGYIGIDSVNPTGLNYIMNFDYYREIGAFTAEHELALIEYIESISNIKLHISQKTAVLISIEDALNQLIGQCDMVAYYVSHGFTTPVYVYGNPTPEQQVLAVGDEVVVSRNTGSFRYATIETTPEALIEETDYCIAKFVTKAAGSIGAAEVQLEAKRKERENLRKKRDAATSADKIAEYTAEINQISADMNSIYKGGLYQNMNRLFRTDGTNGLLKYKHNCEVEIDSYLVEQDDIESDFIIAMGDMLRDGYWNNQNYIEGQEQALFNDANERMNIMCRPSVEYSLNYVRIHKEFGIPLEDYLLNAIFKIHDDELGIHENLFVKKISIGIDDEEEGSIEVTNKDITINTNDLGSLLSRMSQLSDLIEQKNTMYDRAKAISKSGSIYASRLNGQIDVIKNQILSSVSNWYTDDRGNMVFVAADGNSAMMLSGSGFMIADAKDDNGDWDWRTFGTGAGFTADEIVAGFISADRIEAGTISTEKVEPNFGSSLVITGNPSITDLNEKIAPEFEENTPYTKGQMINYGGLLYIFTDDFPGGTIEQASQYLASTSISSQIELLPDKIIQYVGEQGYSKTYLQTTDPTLDPDNEVHIGDYWIIDKDKLTWADVKTLKWLSMKNVNWGRSMSKKLVFCWNGTEWVQVYDQARIEEAFTRITQTKDIILMEAQQYVNGKLIDYSTIEQTAEAIRLTVGNALTGYSTIEQTADAINTKVASALGPYSTTQQTAQAISSYVTNALGSYSTTSQTADAISLAVSDKYSKVSGITIDSSGVEITGSKYIKLRSGGSLDLTSDKMELKSSEGYIYLKKTVSSKKHVISLGRYLAENGSHNASIYFNTDNASRPEMIISYDDYYASAQNKWKSCDIILSSAYVEAFDEYMPCLTGRYFIYNSQTDSYEYNGGLIISADIIESNEIYSLKYGGDGVVNNLTTNTAGYVLDARQGRELNNNKMNKADSFTISANSSKTFTVGNSFRGVFYIIGGTDASQDIVTVYSTSQGSIAFKRMVDDSFASIAGGMNGESASVSTPSKITIETTSTAGQLKITSAMSSTVYVYVMVFGGSVSA